MTPQQARAELGLDDEATLGDAKKARNRKAFETHPDYNPHDPEANEKLRRVQAAYECLKAYFAGRTGSAWSEPGRDHDRSDSGRDDRDDNRTDSGGDEQGDHQPADPVALVREAITEAGIIVLADGFLKNTNHIEHPTTPAERHTYLMQPDVTVQSLTDDLMLDTALRKRVGSRATILTALRKVIGMDAKVRTAEVFKPLLCTLGPTGYSLMLEKLIALVSLIFIGPPKLIALGFLQFIWQVHRKMLGYEVEHHLMPFIWSSAQGAGKSEFVRRLCSPLHELFSPAITLEDYIDTRFVGALDYAVLFVDEIPKQLSEFQVDALKGLITSDEVLRRQLSSSKKLRVKQRSTPIATANGPVERYFYDASGYRRYLCIEMVDGQNRSDVRAAINGFEYSRLWRMMSATDASPILPILPELRAYQAGRAPLSPLLVWLIDLDIDALAMKKIRRSDGFRGDDLRMLFNEVMGEDWSRQRFSTEMGSYFSHPLAPFEGKRVVNGITYYRINAA